jgi:hypothetical protein
MTTTASIESYVYSESASAAATFQEMDADCLIVFSENSGVTPLYARFGAAPALWTTALAGWATAMTAAGAGTYSIAYSATTARVTISSTASFRLVLYKASEGAAALLGFTAGAVAGDSTSHEGEVAPAGRADLLGYDAQPLDDATRVHFRSLRHQRTLATGWGNHDLVELRLYFKPNDIGISIPGTSTDAVGYLLSGRVRITGTDAAVYSATNPDGYLDGYVVTVDEVELLGDDERFPSCRMVLAVPR